MTSRIRHGLSLAVLGACCLWTAPAASQTCGISGTTSTSIGAYNPLSASGLAEVSVTLTLTRTGGTESDKTRSVNFFLIMPAGQAALDIRYRGQSVLHPLSQAPRLSLTSPGSGTIYHDFGGAGQADTVSLPLTIRVPAGLDLVAGQPLIFDLSYICDTIRSGGSVLVPMILNQALTVRIDVASALRASWSGAALNFGEIGDLSDKEAPQRSIEGAVRVASSGPYSISVRSANGYRMTYPGGSPETPSQRIGYAASFLGRLASPQFPRTMWALCGRAGLAGKNLPLRVRLLEGGRDKVAAPEYKDTLTITVAPLVATYSGAVENCP